MLEVKLASWPDEEDVVAELWAGGSYFGEMRVRPDGLIFSLSTTATADPIPVDQLIAVLLQARDRLA